MIFVSIQSKQVKLRLLSESLLSHLSRETYHDHQTSNKHDHQQ